MLDRDDVPVAQIAGVIKADPALLSRLLKEANSPLYARNGVCTTLSQAVQILGMHRVRQVSFSMVSKAYFRSAGFTPTLRACWKHSLATALIADTIAQRLRVQTELAYVMGILHDVGRMAMAACHKDHYARFLKEGGLPVYQLDRERELFGSDHTNVGNRLAGLWKLPAQVALVAGRHHDRPLLGDPWEIFVTNISCRMATAFGYAVGSAKAEKPDEIVASVPRVFQLAIPTDGESWAKNIAKEVKAFE